MNNNEMVIKNSFCPLLALPGGVGPGGVLVVCGRLLGSSKHGIRWAVNLVKGGFWNIPIHLVFQLRAFEDEFGAWWCSSRVQGNWSKMKGVIESFPFVFGKDFELKILLHENSFSVVLDGIKYFTQIPIDPFTLSDIDAVVLAGQWGEVLITEVGIRMDPLLAQPPSNHHPRHPSNPAYPPLAHHPYPPSAYALYDQPPMDPAFAKSQPFDNDVETEADGEELGPYPFPYPDTTYAPFPKAQKEEVYLPGAPPFAPAPLPALQPDPLLHTDPHLQPQLPLRQDAEQYLNTKKNL